MPLSPQQELAKLKQEEKDEAAAKIERERLARIRDGQIRAAAKRVREHLHRQVGQAADAAGFIVVKDDTPMLTLDLPVLAQALVALCRMAQDPDVLALWMEEYTGEGKEVGSVATAVD